MGFLSFLLCFRNNIKNHKYILFHVSHFFVFHRTSLFHSLFSFLFILSNIEEPLTYTWTYCVKLLSPPVPMDSTHFSHYAITEVSRKPKHTHFNSFNTYTFCVRFSHDQILAPLPGMGTFDFTFLLIFLLCFWCAG